MIYLVRHAWAGQPGDSGYPDDALRPLTKAGRSRFAKVVKRLIKIGFAPSIVAVSPLLRARQTADVIARLLPDEPEVIELEELSPGSDLNRLVSWTRRHARSQDAAWVGHAPDIGDLAAALLGAPPESIRLPKGAVAAIDFDDRVERGRGRLTWLATAKLLGV